MSYDLCLSLLLSRKTDVSGSECEEVFHEGAFHNASWKCRKLLKIQVEEFLKGTVISYNPLWTKDALPDRALWNDPLTLVKITRFNSKFWAQPRLCFRNKENVTIKPNNLQQHYIFIFAVQASKVDGTVWNWKSSYILAHLPLNPYVIICKLISVRNIQFQGLTWKRAISLIGR